MLQWRSMGGREGGSCSLNPKSGPRSLKTVGKVRERGKRRLKARKPRPKSHSTMSSSSPSSSINTPAGSKSLVTRERERGWGPARGGGFWEYKRRALEAFWRSHTRRITSSLLVCLFLFLNFRERERESHWDWMISSRLALSRPVLFS